MKSFILTATSIVYIFSISSIADAKVAKTTKITGRNITCQNPITSNSQSNQLFQDNLTLKEDVKAVCQLINNVFTKSNESGLKLENSPVSPGTIYTEMSAIEVSSIKLVDYRKSGLSKTTDVDVDIEFINRKYSMRKNERKWNFDRAENWIARAIFQKKDGQWLRIKYDVERKNTQK